jgi:hypothetical protein
VRAASNNAWRVASAYSSRRLFRGSFIQVSYPIDKRHTWII